uniref:UDP-glucose 4-epimerase n=1 Tax=viral metagenome TaxID=1070528 RepID=A0A6C0C9R3_9ZZZZ
MIRKKIIVTGGTGYIGTHTCISLITDYDLIMIDNLSNSDKSVIDKIKEITGHNEILFYQIDLLNKLAIEEIFHEHHPFAVIHFAGLKSVPKSISHPLMYYQNNLVGTLNLLDTMDKYECHNLIFSSSATVYGNSPSPLSETSNVGIGISNPYGQSKFMIEQILKDLCISNPKWHVISLRYFNPVGVHHSGLICENTNTPDNLMPIILKKIINEETLDVYGDDYDTPDGFCVRDFVHVMDLAVGHSCALDRMNSLSGYNMYNLGTGNGTSVMEFIKTFIRVNNVPLKYKVTNRREGDVPILFCDPNKAKEELGWSAKLSVETMCVDSWRSVNT